MIYNILWYNVPDYNIKGDIYMILEQVKKIIEEQLGVDESEIYEDSAFIEDLGADSLDIVELIMAFESEFDMEIEDDEVENISTVGDVINYIRDHRD